MVLRVILRCNIIADTACHWHGTQPGSTNQRINLLFAEQVEQLHKKDTTGNSAMHYAVELGLNSVVKGFLMIGGTTDLKKGNAGWYAGDLSGILAKKRPFWFQSFYKPGGRIAAIGDWSQKLNEIVEHAREWDIGYIVGVPAWCQMCMEMVIEHYKVKNIHEIWPNFSFFVHGGVAFEPYKKGFEK